MEDFNKAYQEMIEKDKGKKLNDEKANFQNDSIKESGIARKTVDKKLEAQHGYNLYEYIRNDKQAIVDEVLSYLDQGADINFNLNDGCTILMEALSCKNYEIAELLIEKGANLALKDKAGFDALYYANQSEEKTIIKLIEDKLKKQNKDIEKIY